MCCNKAIPFLEMHWTPKPGSQGATVTPELPSSEQQSSYRDGLLTSVYPKRQQQKTEYLLTVCKGQEEHT